MRNIFGTIFFVFVLKKNVAETAEMICEDAVTYLQKLIKKIS